MPQISTPARIIAGRIGDAYDEASASDDLSLIAAAPQAKQVNTITITPQNSTEYTLTLNGVALSYTSDASATAAEIAAGLRAAIQGDPALSGLVTATINGSNNLVITSLQPGLAFTLSVGANLASANTTPNASAAGVPFGAVVLFDNARAQGGKQLAADAFTGDAAVFTPTAENASVYRIVAEIEGHDPFTLSYTSDGSATVAEITAGLHAAFGALSPAPANVTSADNTTTYGLTAANGATLNILESSANLSLAYTRGSRLGDLIAGVALRRDVREPNLIGADEEPGYFPNDTMSVRARGRARVGTEEACQPGNPVYVRVAANGANDKAGRRFRQTPDAGAVLLAGARWHANQDTTIAVIQL